MTRHKQSAFTILRHSSGFTIVELLVVIVVIGILAALTVVSYTGISQRAIVASMNSDLASAARRLQLYQVENNDDYPTANNCPTPGPTEICLKSSSGITFSNFETVNSTSPKTFCLTVTRGTTEYYMTESLGPTIGNCFQDTGDVYYHLRTLSAGDTTIATDYANIDIEMVVLTGNQTISANTSWGNATADARMLGVRVEGDLTVNAGVTLTAAARKRGMAIYVTGNTTINGTISMTARGASAPGQRVLLLNRGTPYEVPAVGGAGAAIACAWSLGFNGVGGNSGVSGVATGSAGGGGSGGGGCYRPNVQGYGVCSGTGGDATSYSGGSGSGGSALSELAGSGTSDNGGINGGAGSSGWGTWGAGGGAGNNGGAGVNGGQAGTNGTGGLLVVYTKGLLTFGASGTLSSTGSAGGIFNTNNGTAPAGGGGSGGGRIDYFYKTISGSPIIDVAGGLGGTAWGGSGYAGPGGPGGAGSSRAVQYNF